MEIQQNVLLKDWSWWKIGGPADYFCTPEDITQIQEAVRFAQDKSLPITVLGGGTNVLISDLGVAGLVINMKKLAGLEVKDGGNSIEIVALAGTPKSELTKIFLKRSMAPALFLCGLPGDVGGGVVMNAGVSEAITPREFVELTDWIEVLDLSSPNLELKRFSRDQISWKYRASSGWQPGIMVRVGLSWPNVREEEISRKVREATRNRLQRQPLEWPSCGSTFKNPPGLKAGALIEQAGLKGYQVGQAQVSSKHANFIINLGGALASDVRKIIEHVRTSVKKTANVELETEVKMLGRW